jgi:hypothetical protein
MTMTDATKTSLTDLDFSAALTHIKHGELAARAGWNGKDMFVFLVPGSTFMVNRPPLLGIYQSDTQINYHAHIDMKTADGMVVPWMASQSDLLDHDWTILSRRPQEMSPQPTMPLADHPSEDQSGEIKDE